MPKYIKHYTQDKLIKKFDEKKNRKFLILSFFKNKNKKKKKKTLKLKYTAFSHLKSRCMLSGRAKAYYSQFKLSRHALKKMFSTGKVPGLTLSSW